MLLQKATVVRTEVRGHLGELPGYANLVIGDLRSEISDLDERIAKGHCHVSTMARDCNAAQQLMQLMAVGPTTATATAIVAMVGNARNFGSGQHFAAWPGRADQIKLDLLSKPY